VGVVARGQHHQRRVGKTERQVAVSRRDVLRLADDVGEAQHIAARHRDLALGLADASLVVLAARYHTDEVLTVDHRHFRVVAAPGGHPFRVLPADG
jgi:predicted nucleic acid-binding protein